MQDNLIKMRDFDENKISAEEISSVSRILGKLIVNFIQLFEIDKQKRIDYL